MDILQEAALNIGFDWRMALANLFNFIIIFFLLKRFVWSSIKETLDSRKSTIEQGLKDAEDAKVLEERAQSDYDAKLKEADEEAFSVMSTAYAQGKDVLDGAHKKASKDAEKILEAGRNTLLQEKVEMQKELSNEAVELVMSGVEKVIKEKMSLEKDADLIRASLK